MDVHEDKNRVGSSEIALTTLRSLKEGFNPEEIWRLVIDLVCELEKPSQGAASRSLAPTQIKLVAGKSAPHLRLCEIEEQSAAGISLFTAPELMSGGGVSTTTNVWLAARIGFWAANPTVRPLVGEYLREALDPDPSKRPSSKELISALTEEAAAKIALPATVPRDHLKPPERAIQPRPTILQRVRLAGMRGGGLRPVWAIFVFFGLAAATYLAMSTTASSQVAVSAFHQIDKSDDLSVSRLLQDLIAKRDRALRTHDEALLASVSVPGSAIAHEDQELFDLLQDSTPTGLTTNIELLDATRGTEEIVAQALLRQEEFAWSGGVRDGITVAALPPRCTQMKLELYEDQWRVAAVSACAASTISG